MAEASVRTSNISPCILARSGDGVWSRYVCGRRRWSLSDVVPFMGYIMSPPLVSMVLPNRPNSSTITSPSSVCSLFSALANPTLSYIYNYISIECAHYGAHYACLPKLDRSTVRVLAGEVAVYHYYSCDLHAPSVQAMRRCLVSLGAARLLSVR